RGGVLHADDPEGDAPGARARLSSGDDLRRGEERVAREHAARVGPVVEAEVPDGVAGRVPARERERPGEDEPAVDDPRLREGARAAVLLVEVQRVGVPEERGELHVLAVAEGPADLVGEHVTHLEILPEPGEAAMARRRR